MVMKTPEELGYDPFCAHQECGKRVKRNLACKEHWMQLPVEFRREVFYEFYGGRSVKHFAERAREHWAMGVPVEVDPGRYDPARVGHLDHTIHKELRKPKQALPRDPFEMPPRWSRPKGVCTNPGSHLWPVKM